MIVSIANWKENENTKQNKATIEAVSKLSTFRNQSISTATKGPLKPVSERNHDFYVIVGQFSNDIVTVPPPKNLLRCKLTNSALNVKFWFLQNLITDSETE